MDAAAFIRAEPSVVGGSRIVSLDSDGPIQLRNIDEVAYIDLAPESGDDLWLDISVEPGATLALRGLGGFITPADPFGLPSHLTVSATIGDGATLDWQPQPTVSVAGSRFRTSTSILLGADSKLTFVDDLCLGQQSEAAGAVTSTLQIRRQDRLLVRHTNRLGGDATPEQQQLIGDRIRRVTTMIRSVNQPEEDNPIRWKMAAFDDSVAASMQLEDLRFDVTIVQRSNHSRPTVDRPN